MFKCEYCEGLFESKSHIKNCSKQMLLDLNKKYKDLEETVGELNDKYKMLNDTMEDEHDWAYRYIIRIVDNFKTVYNAQATMINSL